MTNCDNLMTYGVYKEFRKVDDHAPFVKVRVRQESLPCMDYKGAQEIDKRLRKCRKTREPMGWEHYRR